MYRLRCKKRSASTCTEIFECANCKLQYSIIKFVRAPILRTGNSFIRILFEKKIKVVNFHRSFTQTHTFPDATMKGNNAHQSLWWLFVISPDGSDEKYLYFFFALRYNFVEGFCQTFSACFSVHTSLLSRSFGGQQFFSMTLTEELWKWYTNWHTRSHCAAWMQFNYKCQSNAGAAPVFVDIFLLCVHATRTLLHKPNIGFGQKQISIASASASTNLQWSAYTTRIRQISINTKNWWTN